MSERAHDVAIVGAGPVGLATAVAARSHGLDVVVVDRRQPPLDKACGEGLMPDGAAVLESLGVDVARLGRPFVGIRYVDGPHVAAACFRRPGYGIRRTTLHRVLVERAEAAGARLCWGESVVAIERDGLRTSRRMLRARQIVGADGLHSGVRRLAGWQAPAPRGRRFGVRRHIEVEPWTDHVEVHWSDEGEAYVTPVGPSSVGVAVLWRGGASTRPAGLEPFPELRRRVAGRRVVSRERGAGPLEQRVRCVGRGRVSLVGDASGYVDAITGEGLSVGFHEAVALGDALAAGDLRPYGAAHRRIVARPTALTRLLLVLSRRPRLRRRAVATLAAAPELFERVLAIHARDEPPRHLGARGLARLAWGLAHAPARRLTPPSACGS